ncbi:MAG: S1C family serine protease [Pirellula sp.]|jgi:S1-C subfamily serine protease|nr:S1C family serine protease [Pirellula sp.]
MIARKYGDCPSRLIATFRNTAVIALFCFTSVLAFALSTNTVLGQERLGEGQSQSRTSAKPAVASYFSTIVDSPSATTKIPLPDALRSLALGADPRDKNELVILQKQQASLSKLLPLVTVNLQHGNTQGSGVIVSGDGYILTAAHVAGKASQRIQITLHDGTRVDGESLGLNRNEDAGVVKITTPLSDPKQPWPHASLGRSNDLRNGSWVIAVGHPGGWQSDRPAVIRVGRVLKMIDSTMVTDCPLIGGDSGGPLFDLEGKLIGIHSRIGVDVEENMHVPIEVFYNNHERLISREVWGALPGFQPFIGVAGARDEDSNGRCLIQEVGRDTPAFRAGMRSGDVVVKFDGNEITRFQQLKDAVDSMVPGDSVWVEIERDSKRMRLRMIIGSKN